MNKLGRLADDTPLLSPGATQFVAGASVLWLAIAAFFVWVWMTPDEPERK